MSGSEIHWLWDAVIVFVCAPVLLVIISPFMLSSKISRDEEERELRAAFDRLKKVA